MHRAWVVVLAGCGFHSNVAPGDDVATMDASSSDGNPGICWKISDTVYGAHWSACANTTALTPSIDVMTSVSIDTNGGDSSPPGFTCAPLTASSEDVCALVASSIKIEPGIILSAHGDRPLALLGHSIDIQGMIDVASHITNSQRGAGAIAANCRPKTPAQSGGGGAGGVNDNTSGTGGDQGGTTNTGGSPGYSVATTFLHGGCDGGRGGNGDSDGGPAGVGGAGGGAVWIASDMGMLTLGSGAVINASGAGGAGATSDNHGGYGGGSGGMIVLQSSTIMRDASAQIFANGGHGGGGGAGGNPGSSGSDPTGPTSGGGGGQGGVAASGPQPGDGGTGFPSMMLDGANGNGQQQGGGGGGGGGPGVIRVASSTSIGGSKVSPVSVKWMP
jgi:hypothetical protein